MTITSKTSIPNYSNIGQTLWIYDVILSMAVAYTLLCKLKHNNGYHSYVFTNIFQMEHNSAVKFTVGYEECMNSLLTPKFLFFFKINSE